MEEQLPTVLAQLVSRLRSMGFSVTADEQVEAVFGSGVLELSNYDREEGRVVRLIRDGGLWSVEIDVAGKWRDPYQVLLALDGSKYATRASSNEERLRFTLDALERMPPASKIESLVKRLEEFDRAYWRRLGVKDAGGRSDHRRPLPD